MCYSAMVLQSQRKLGIRFKARIDYEEYSNLFSRRLDGEKLILNKGIEFDFVDDPKNPEEKKLKKIIETWHTNEVSRLEAEIFKQKERFANAERALKTKTTKKAQEDLRISTNKVEKAKSDLKRHGTHQLKSDSDSRIFPFHYLSMLTLNDDGEKVIAPFRYLMRPHDKDESFDREYGGCYNARFDNLKRVAFWKDSLEKRRGLILVKKFYENVAVQEYLKHHKLPNEKQADENMVLCFEPDNVEYMFIPTLWDVWKKKGESPLYSTALITDEPLPEIAQAGHDRTPIFLKESAIDAWLGAQSAADAIQILGERERPHYSHKVIGAVA